MARDPSQHYPTGYVHALENHVAMLEQSLNGFNGSASDHLDAGRSQPLHVGHSGFTPSPSGVGQSQPFSMQAGSSTEVERAWYWQPPQIGNTFDDSLFAQGGLSVSHPSPPDFAALPAQTPLASPRPANPPKQTAVIRQEGMDEIPTATVRTVGERNASRPVSLS